jgi:hypothetical protein
MPLSVRLEPDVEQAFEQEVRRRKTTKSQFVNELLREALKPKDPMQLLMEIRAEYNIPEPKPGTPRTNRSANVGAEVRKVLKKKHRAFRAG